MPDGPLLVVVDLESANNPDIGAMTVASIHRHVAPEATLRVVIPGGPMDLRAADRIVVTGSASMLDDVPWADETARVVAAAAEAGVPVLAICFGHQMMARHFGGRIASFADVQKGVQTIRFQATGPFSDGEVALIHTHRDHVVDPGLLVPCAEGGFGGIAATRHPGWPLWTIQGHPEWDAAIARADDPFWLGVLERELATPDGKRLLTAFGSIPSGPDPANPRLAQRF